MLLRFSCEGEAALDIILYLWLAFAFSSFGILGANYIATRRAAKQVWRIQSNKDYKPRVSIIVPTYNEFEVIKYKLENLVRLEYPEDLLQIVFVDSQSTDGTIDKIRDFAEGNPRMDVKILIENERKGKSVALNTALSACDGEVAIVSDADCFWPSNILKGSLPYLSDPAIGAISGPKKLLNPEDTWTTRNESRYLESMNLMKLGESKMSSTIFFEGGFSAYKKTLLEAFDPYHTGSDDCGTIIGILQRNARAIMVPEAQFFTFFPKSWQGRMEMKMRRAIQLVRVFHNYMSLLIRGEIKTMRKMVIKNLLLYLLAPIMFLFFMAMTVILFLSFPPAALMLCVFLIPGVNNYLVETLLSYLILSYSMVLAAFKKRPLVWKKPEDRKLVREEALLGAGLI